MSNGILYAQARVRMMFPVVRRYFFSYISGEINLKVKYSPANEEIPGKLFISGNHNMVTVINVAVIQGRHLASRDSNGLSDPYVKLSFGEDKRKTQVVYESLYPLWREDFEL
jgi:Ca2+-dependent lipid-binding protein